MTANWGRKKKVSFLIRELQAPLDFYFTNEAESIFLKFPEDVLRRDSIWLSDGDQIPPKT